MRGRGPGGAQARIAAAMRGLTLVEIAMVMAIMSLLLGLAAPSIRSWLRNTQVRASTETLLAGLRFAQAEAIRRDRQVVLVRTAGPNCTAAALASAAGVHWTVRTVEVLAGEGSQVLRCGALGENAAGIAVAGPAVLCFTPGGRLTGNADPGAGGAACVAGASAFDVSGTGSDRPLRITVPLSGSARSCDPAKPSSQPDACPTP